MLPVYIGPALSGLASHPIAILPAFLGLYLLHYAVTRRPDLKSAVGWAGLVLAAIVEVSIIGGLFAAGWGAGLIFGTTAMPFWLPLALTAMGVAVAAWLFRDAAEMEVFLQSALEKIADLDAQTVASWDAPPLRPQSKIAFDDAISALRDLEQDAGQGVIDPIVNALAKSVGAEAFDDFYDVAGVIEGCSDRRIDLALLRYCSIPSVRRTLLQQGDLGLAPMLMITAPDADIRHFARAMLNGMMDAHAPCNQLPDPVWLDQLEQTYPNEGYHELAQRRRNEAMPR
ncbi:MAG: hypothetical protein ACRBCL_06085 [Maritimibacter sp.]